MVTISTSSSGSHPQPLTPQDTSSQRIYDVDRFNDEIMGTGYTKGWGVEGEDVNFSFTLHKSGLFAVYYDEEESCYGNVPLEVYVLNTDYSTITDEDLLNLVAVAE